MKEGQASRTAEYMALFRALESSLPAGRRLFDDPFAREFLGPRMALVARLGTLPGLRELVLRVIDRRWPGARTSGVARTRFIDDAVGADEGQFEQFVVLGAGFDSRAYRLPGLRKTTVFEVDHPDTLSRKRTALTRALGAFPEHIRFVPTDFNQDDLEQAMAAAGYRESARTLFLWEGVTNYLTEAAVDATLRWCSRAAPGSRLLFTYVERSVLEHPQSFFGTERLFATLAAANEAWTWGIEPCALPEFLAQRGLSLEQDAGAEEYRRIYWGERARTLRGYEFYRIAVAGVSQTSGDPGE
jgi:methyltransferase (TIGR00027 family)